MHGIVISWPAYLPWDILASMVFGESFVITHLVPLVTLGGYKDCKMVIGAASFNDSRWERSPETTKEFRNSIGKCTIWNSSSTESNDLYSTDSPGNCVTKLVLIACVVSLKGAKIQHSKSHAISLKLEGRSGD